MADFEKNDSIERKVDEKLQQWSQGDCVIGEYWFIHRCAPELPLTSDSQEAAFEGVDVVESSVRGLVILTQTCDIVRRSVDRPFIEVAPLVEVPEEKTHSIERCERPQYASIPSLRIHRLVADLDRTMTVEKAVVAKWPRTPGCRTDDERRRFAWALARKRSRCAFPDDFTRFAEKLTARLSDKHNRQSDEGRALRTLREIRIRAAPSWDATLVELTFWFIRKDDETDFEGKRWDAFLAIWQGLIPASDRFEVVNCFVTELQDLTARDYVESDILDFDHLSTRGE
jgi:hypothetical protein